MKAIVLLCLPFLLLLSFGGALFLMDCFKNHPEATWVIAVALSVICFMIGASGLDANNR